MDSNRSPPTSQTLTPQGAAGQLYLVGRKCAGGKPATSRSLSTLHTTDFPGKMVVKSKGNLLISGKSRLVKYYSIWPQWWLLKNIRDLVFTDLTCGFALEVMFMCAYVHILIADCCRGVMFLQAHDSHDWNILKWDVVHPLSYGRCKLQCGETILKDTVQAAYTP